MQPFSSINSAMHRQPHNLFNAAANIIVNFLALLSLLLLMLSSILRCCCRRCHYCCIHLSCHCHGCPAIWLHWSVKKKNLCCSISICQGQKYCLVVLRMKANGWGWRGILCQEEHIPLQYGMAQRWHFVGVLQKIEWLSSSLGRGKNWHYQGHFVRVKNQFSLHSNDEVEGIRIFFYLSSKSHS